MFFIVINYSLTYRSRYVDEGGTKVKKAFAYAKAQAAGILPFEEFAERATKTSVYGSGVLAAVVCLIADEIVEKVKMSYRVTCGSLGVFGPAVSSAGVEDIATFSPNAHIKKAYVKWTKPGKLATLKDASFRLVSTCADQAEMNKAMKNASATVNLGDSTTKETARTQNAPSDGD